MKKKENKNNVEMICKECSDERKTKWQKEHKGFVIEEGDFVKIAIENKKDETEHIWCKIVSKGTKNTFKGTIDNMPILDMPLKYGDSVDIQFKDIEDYLAKDDKY
jgi:uncharacterized protein YegJ (DUF2314 family)